MPTVEPQVNLEDIVEDPATPPASFFRGLAEVTALRYSRQRGFFYQNLERGVLLYHLVRESGCERVLDVGTGRGYSALCSAAALRDCGGGGTVTTVDVTRANSSQMSALGHEGRFDIVEASVKDLMARLPRDLVNRVRFLEGDSQRVIRRLGKHRELFGLAYIDGSHSFMGALADLAATLGVMEDGGTIVFDDYRMPGVKKVVDALRGELPGSIDLPKTAGLWPRLSGEGNGFGGKGQAMAVCRVAHVDGALDVLGKKRHLSEVYAFYAPVREVVAWGRRARKIRLWGGQRGQDGWRPGERS